MAISLGSGFFTVKAKDEATGAVRGIGENVRTNLANLANTAVTTMAVAGTAVLGFMAASVRAFGIQEKAEAQLNAVIKSTGAAAGLTADELKKMAAEIQKTTIYGDESVIMAQSLLLTFTSIGRDVFPEAIKVIVDMSTALGQDLKSSTIQVGKALNDPIKGITALSRVGVSFTEQQKQVIAALVQTGDVASAQKKIIEELAKEFGGSAAAEAATFTGQLQQLKNEIGDVMEQVGQAFIPILKQLGEEIKSLVAGMARWISAEPEMTESIVKWAAGISVLSVGIKTLTPLFTVLRTGIGWVISGVLALAAALELPVIAVAAMVAGLVAGVYLVIDNWKEVGPFFMGLAEIIGNALLQVVIGITALAVGLVDNVILPLAENIGLAFTHPIDAILNGWRMTFDILKGWMDSLVSYFATAWGYAADFVKNMAEGISYAMGYGGGSGAQVPGMAGGGRVGRGGVVEVGERGPELLFLPRGAEVLPARETAGLLGGGGVGGVSVNVNFGGVTIREEADLDRLVRKMTGALEGVLSQRGLRLA